MIASVALGINTPAAATEFYYALFGLLGARRLEINERITLWSTGRDQPMLGIAKPCDEQDASAGNGTMVA